MPSDPGLSGDTCIYSEAVSGDGGVHPATNFWLSPDISLTGPVSGPDKADPGQVNICQVKFHRKAAASRCIFSNAESLTVELWVGNPAIVMTPDNPASAVKIGFIGSSLPAEGQSGTQSFDWTPPTGLPLTNPEGPGHKCLIARVYPDNLTASPQGFFVPDDQHVVQRNICVVPCNSSNRSQQSQCAFTVTTVNPDARNPQTVKVAVSQDLRPEAHVKKTVLRALRPTGVGNLSLRRAKAFGFYLNDFPDAEISDTSGAGTGATYEAQIKMEAGQLTRFDFFADLSGGSTGDVYIFHLSQSDADRQVQGGLTIVMVLSS